MWGFAEIVAKKLSNNKDNDERTTNIDLRTSIMKPLHQIWPKPFDRAM
jgi:phosphoglycerol transferase MdoB-like AlkP superfamily enzyme